MDIENFVDLLRENVLKFSYWKTDGSLRVAYGTLNGDVIANYAPPSKGKRKRTSNNERNNSTVTYFDIEASDWRSFREDRFNDIDLDYGD